MAYATLIQLKALLADLDGSEDALLADILDRSSQAIDRLCERTFTSTQNVVRVYDGDWLPRLYLRDDFVTITQVRVRATTQEAWRVVPLADIVLEPASRRPGHPAHWIEIVSFPTGPDFVFPRGKQTVEVTGTTGWAAVPVEVTEVCLELAVRVWRARGAGSSELGVSGIDQVITTKALPAFGYQIIQRLTRNTVFA